MTIMLANPERIAREVIGAALKPAPPIDFLAWAARHVVINEGSFPGPYNRSLFCYFDEVLRALSPEDPCRYVSLMASAQCGKTTLANVFTLASLTLGHGTVLYVHPTLENSARWSRMKLGPLMRSTPVVRDQFPERARDGADAVLFKERRDGLARLVITGSNSAAGLSQLTAERQVQDDLAKFEMNSAGDPEAQADSRSRAIEFAKIFKVGTPLVVPGCRISKNFELGSQEMPFVPCPHCMTMQVLTWDNMLAGLDAAKPEDAHFSCEGCGGLIEEKHRPQMLAGFEWRAKNPAAKREHRSFWIWSAYSYLQSWERIAREWLKNRGNPAAEQTFLNDTAGLAYRAHGEARAWEELRDRASESTYVRGTVPAGALLLMCGIDCQGDRVEWQIVGFGRDYRRYVIDFGIIQNHVADPDCRRNLDLLLAKKWKNAFGRELGIEMTAIDGNAWTEDVFDFARHHPSSRLIMIRGRGDDSAPRLARVRKERDKRGNLLKYSKRFYHLGVSILKMSLYRDLSKDDPLSNGFVAFPSGLEDEYYIELTSERRVAVKRNGFDVFRWVKPDAIDNEALDTLVQATGAAIKFGVYGMSDISWAKIEAERETPPAHRQGDIEDLLTAPRADGTAAQRPRKTIAHLLAR